MNTYLSRVPRLSLHLMAFGWSSAAILTLAAWMTVPLPFWILVLAYLLPAIVRPRGAGLGVAAALVVAAASAFLVPLGDLIFAALLLLAESARALTLSRLASVNFLRIEQRRGMALVLLTVLLRAIVGSPNIWLIALCAAVYLVGALVGLPLAQSAENAGHSADHLATALPGLQLLGPLVVLGGLMGGVVALGHMLAAAGWFDWLWSFLWILLPLGYVAAWLIRTLPHILRPPRQRPIKVHHLLHLHARVAHGTTAQVALAIAAMLLLVGTFYLAYGRYRRGESTTAAPLGSAQNPGASRSRLATHGAPDYGRGARRRVRLAMRRHVVRKRLPPGITVRQYAEREGLPEEILRDYEHARYAFTRSFAMNEARAFVAALARHVRRR